MSEALNPIEEDHLPEYEKDFGNSESEEIGMMFFESLPGVINVEKATYKEDVLGEVQTDKKQPKVDFWIEIGSEDKKDSTVIGIQWTISNSGEKLKEKKEKQNCDINYAYKEEHPDTKIKTHQPCTVVLLKADKEEIGDLYNNCLGLDEEERKALIFAELSRLRIPQNFIRELNEIERKVLAEAIL